MQRKRNDGMDLNEMFVRLCELFGFFEDSEFGCALKAALLGQYREGISAGIAHRKRR